MKILKKFTALCLAVTMLFGVSCSTMNKTGKGALIGGGGGAAVGAGIGALIGGGKGAGIGAAIGSAVGAGAGALIGQKMDKQQKELEAQLAQQAKVEQTTDSNGLQAIKLTFDGGILFATGKYNLSDQAQADLTKFAVNLLENPGTDVSIVGYTDNTDPMPSMRSFRASVPTPFAIISSNAECRPTVSPPRESPWPTMWPQTTRPKEGHSTAAWKSPSMPTSR